MISFLAFRFIAALSALFSCLPAFADDASSTPNLGIGQLSASASSHAVTLNLSQPLSGGSGVGYEYKIWRATQPGIPPQGKPYKETSNFPYIDTDVAPGASYYYKVQGFDSTGRWANAEPQGLEGVSSSIPLPLAVTTPTRTLLVVYIGDSITFGAYLDGGGTAGGGTPPYWCDRFLSAMGGTQDVYGANIGRAGFTTKDWLPGGQGSCFADAETAATRLVADHSEGQLIFPIMLGTNDSATRGPNGSPVSDEAYVSNLETTITRLLTDFPHSKIVLNDAPYYSPNTHNFSDYQETGLARLTGYRLDAEQVVSYFSKSKRGRVYLGDTQSYPFFQAHSLTELKQETATNGATNGDFYLHPTAAGAEDLGHLWSLAIQRAVDAPDRQHH